MYSFLKKFMADETGATSIEYALVASGLSLAVLTAVNALGVTLNNKYVSIGAAIQ